MSEIILNSHMTVTLTKVYPYRLYSIVYVYFYIQQSFFCFHMISKIIILQVWWHRGWIYCSTLKGIQITSTIFLLITEMNVSGQISFLPLIICWDKFPEMEHLGKGVYLKGLILRYKAPPCHHNRWLYLFHTTSDELGGTYFKYQTHW